MYRRVLFTFVLLMSALTSSFNAFAQSDYPVRPIRLIVPFTPGGTSDLMGRLMAKILTQKLGQPVIVENMSGAGGAIGAAFVARAPADGYTLLASGIGSDAIIHAFKPAPPYDDNKDFVHISELAAGPNVLVVNPKFPAKTFKEFIAWVKAHPGQFNYGQVFASSGHLTTEYLKQTAGLQMAAISYKGGSDALTAVLADQIDGMFTNQDVVLQQVRSGTLRALAVTSAQRNPKYPDVPTVAESGYPGFSAVSWTGLSAPKGTSPAIVQKLETAMRAGLADPAVRAKLEATGFVVEATTSEQYTQFVRSEIAHWQEVVNKAGITRSN